jgi:nucleoid DNA-binding protein
LDTSRCGNERVKKSANGSGRLGTFSCVKEKPERAGILRHAKDQISAKKVVKFKAGKELAVKLK